MLSHLGSSAEIGAATLLAATGGGEAPGDGFNESVWDRWNAMSPREQADGYLAADAALVAAFEALTPQQRADLQVRLGFLPAPLPLAAYAGMRLNEAAQHSWDVRVGFDDHAAIDEGAARLLVDHLGNGLGFLLGFTGKADAVNGPALVGLADLDHALSVTDAVALVPAGGDLTASFVGPADAVARLFSGAAHPALDPRRASRCRATSTSTTCGGCSRDTEGPHHRGGTVRTSTTVDGWVVRATSGPVPARLDHVEVAATVPGTVHTDLLDAGLIPDPYVDEGERELAWMRRASWRYSTRVRLEPPGPDERVDLVFAGIDTVAPSTSAARSWPGRRTCTVPTASTCAPRRPWRRAPRSR